MVQMFINGVEVVLPATFSFRLTDCNPYLIDKGKYTMEIELPLRGCLRNQQVFGTGFRMESGKEILTFPAQVIVDGRSLINGTAVTTGYTDVSVKVQVVGGKSDFNFFNRMEDTYLDELPLHLEDDIDCPLLNLTYANSLTDGQRRTKLFGSYGETDYVYFPIYNSQQEVMYNPLAWIPTSGSSSDYIVWPPHEHHGTEAPALDGTIGDIASAHVAHQPYLCYLIRKVFEALGYTLVVNEIEDTPLCNLYVASTMYNDRTPDRRYRTRSREPGDTTYVTCVSQAILPHWTVSEFISQIEMFFGVVVIISEGSLEARIIFRDTQPGSYTVRTVVDEYTCECDKDAGEGSLRDVGFAFEEQDKFQYVDPDVLSGIEVQEVHSVPSAITQGYKIIQYGGRQYITKGQVRTPFQINRFRDLVLDPYADTDRLELKIVPVMMALAEVGFEPIDVVPGGESTPTRYYPGEPVMHDVQVPTVSEEVPESNRANVYQRIEDGVVGQKTYEPLDVLKVALACDELSAGQSGIVSMPLGYTTDEWMPDNSSKERDVVLMLNDIYDMPSLYPYVSRNQVPVNRKVAYTFRFLTDDMPDPTSLFIIRNKAYRCESLEYQVSEKGRSSLVTGKFYEPL